MSNSTDDDMTIQENQWDRERSGWHNPYTNAYLYKPSALLSIISSYIIIREVVSDIRRSSQSGNNSTPLPMLRALLTMCVGDILSSSGFFLGTWMIPSDIDTDVWQGTDWIPGNVGNTATCSFQGFILIFGIGINGFSILLFVIFSLLLVRYGWKVHQLRKIEPWCQLCNWCFVLAMATIPLSLKMYNSSSDSFCWIASYPSQCLDSFRHGEDATCVRGDNAFLVNLCFHLFLWFVIFTIVFLLFLIWKSVRKVEDAVSRYNFGASGMSSWEDTGSALQTVGINPGGTQPAGIQHGGIINPLNRSRSEAVGRQTILYILSFLCTYSLSFTYFIVVMVLGKQSDPLLFFNKVLLPLQGFFNLLIFSRTREEMKTREGQIAKQIFFVTCLRCSCRNQNNQCNRKAPPAAASTFSLGNSEAKLEGNDEEGDRTRAQGSLRSSLSTEKSADFPYVENHHEDVLSDVDLPGKTSNG